MLVDELKILLFLKEKVSVKSDDESEPRSPSEAYSSDDDKVENLSLNFCFPL